MIRQSFRHGELAIDGLSVAGASTWFRVRPPGIGLDAGGVPLELAGTDHLFLTHGHLDHSLGLPLVLSQRVRAGAPPPRVYCPAATARALERYVAAAAELEGEPLPVEVVPLAPGDRVEIAPGFTVEAFATEHTVPSLGCLLWRAKERLLPELAALSGEEIARRRHAGEPVTRSSEELALAYCGDTSNAVFEREPRVFKARVLLVECTFLGDRTRGRGERYGHLHLDDLVAVASRFENEAIVLHHLSRRHRPDELAAAVAERMPEVAERVTVLGAGEAR